MNSLKKYSLFILTLILCLSMTLFAGCQFSSTHESEANLTITTGEEEDTDDTADTPIEKACIDIDKYLADDWPDSYNISYTGEDGGEDANTIYVLFWKSGIKSIDNMDQLIEYMQEYSETFSRIMADAGVENGHLELEILTGVEDEDSYKDGSCVLEVADGEIVYNAYAED